MSESEARATAQAHVEAVLNGDTDRVVADIVEEHREAVFAEAANLPSPVIASSVESAEFDNGVLTAVARYSGEGGSAVRLQSTWHLIDGRYQIVAAQEL